MHWIMLGSWVGLGESKGEGALMMLVSVGLGGGDGVRRGLLRPRGISILPLMIGPVTGCLVFPAWCFVIQLMVH